MYQDTVGTIAGAAKTKISFMKSQPVSFFLMSMMAGVFIGLGACLMLVIGGAMAGEPLQKFFNGLVFSVGLCMVISAGAELFTGSNLVMTVGALSKEITWGNALLFWIICWVGNLAGSVITGLLFSFTGIPAAGEYAAAVAAGKMAGTPLSLFSKAILCNICVCVAIWCASKLKSEGAKIAMAVACVVCFVSAGYEHSIANMTYLTIGLLNPAGIEGITLSGMAYNLAVVTLGNMVGGCIFVAVPYYITGKKK